MRSAYTGRMPTSGRVDGDGMGPPALPMSLALGRSFRSRFAELRRGEMRSYRMLPLLVDRPSGDMLRRRQHVFDEAAWSPSEIGHVVEFKLAVKPKGSGADRVLSGAFEVIDVTPAVCVLGSTLDRDAFDHGPLRLAKRSYPLARRPFITSAVLEKLLSRMADGNGWSAESADATGYDRETNQFRRDGKKQPIEIAFREMREQGRHVHRMKVTFRDSKGRRAYRASFDRQGGVSVEHGDPTIAFLGFVAEAVRVQAHQDTLFAGNFNSEHLRQDAITLQYDDKPFRDTTLMRKLCDTVRKADGMSVTLIHLNPYCQAQVLDFMTGAALDLLITDERCVSLVPRTARCKDALNRVTATIQQFFGEATVSRASVAASC